MRYAITLKNTETGKSKIWQYSSDLENANAIQNDYYKNQQIDGVKCEIVKVEDRS